PPQPRVPPRLRAPRATARHAVHHGALRPPRGRARDRRGGRDDGRRRAARAGGRALAPPSGAPRGGPGPRPADARRARHLVRARRPSHHHAPGGGCGAARHLPRAGAARRARGRAAHRGGGGAPRPEAGARMTPAVALWPGVVVRRRLADYAALTKPRVVAMVLVTTATGYYLGSAGTPRLVPLLHALAGPALAAAAPLRLHPSMGRA